MEYILTIYFIFAVDVALIQKSIPDIATCKEEAEKIVLELDLPPSTMIYVECAGVKLGLEV